METRQFKTETIDRLTQLEINKMTEKQLQETYIKYLQKRLLKMDEKCTCGGRK
tara:strand:+ start:1723 stop:1881 length:159 start_codon:yes stop_codon:yes gene_type:complete